jgi:hypothetical protein
MPRVANILLAGVFILIYSFPILGQIEPKLLNSGSQNRVSNSTARNLDNVTQYNEMKEMIQLSEFIVVGKVTSAFSYWGVDSLIWTRFSFSIIENIKGFNQGSLTIVEKGGEVGNIGLISSNSFRFTQGKDYLLFLKHDSNGAVVPVDTRGAKLLEGKNGSTSNMVNILKNEIQNSRKENKNETR